MIKTYIDGVLQEDNILPPADRTKLNNLSGTNTGDETASTIINKIGDGSKINSNYLPSYVDDVLEFANVASFPATGETGKIYIALDVNLTYRWGGSGYVEISPSIALGETSATAYRGDRGASAYAHSILADGTNPHATTFANIQSKPTTIAGYGITNGVTLTGTETLTNKTINSPAITGTPTGITATHVGLGNVTNNAQVKKVASSTDNAIMRWDGATGDLPQNSLVTISDTGTVNVPTGQNYNINGVNLKDVSETLTNKTLTSPVLNTEATGTAVSTTGGINKVVKTDSNGSIILQSGGNSIFKADVLDATFAINGIANTAGDISGITFKNLYSNAGVIKAGFFAVTDSSVHTGRVEIRTSGNGSEATTKLTISGNGNIKMASLAGTGTRMVVADANGNLSAGVADYTISLPMSATPPVSTGININGGLGGKTIMLYFSAQWDDGRNTASGIYMIRCGFNGDFYNLINIAQDGYYLPTFSQVSGVLHISFPTNALGIIRVTANK